MADRLLNQDIAVVAWDRQLDHAQPLAERGADVAGTAGEVVSSAQIVITMLPTAEIVLSVVEPLRDQPDGSYRITVDLHPADLGRVQVEVRLERGEVNLHLQADHASTSALLRDALHDLRDGLQSAGLRTGGVVVSNGDAARHGSADAAERDTANAANRDGTTSRSGTDDVTDVATTGPAYAPTSSDALVDVRV